MSVSEGVILPLHILKCSSCHIQIVITQEYAFCNFKYRFDKWRWRKLTFLRNTVMHCRIILKICQMLCLEFAHQNWHGIYWYSSKISFWWTLIKIKQLQFTETVSRNLIFVYVISIAFEIAGITVKMVCKITFDNNYRFGRILKSYFLRKTQQSLFSTCFFVPRYAWMNTKFITL